MSYWTLVGLACYLMIVASADGDSRTLYAIGLGIAVALLVVMCRRPKEDHDEQ